MIILRPYQTEAISALWAYWREAPGGVPLIVAPTGSGKSLIIASICEQVKRQRPNYNILIVSHRKEIIEQNANEISKLTGAPVGIFSAGLGIKNFRSITCANIQSVYKREIEANLVIVDECHLFSGKDDSMYGKLMTKLRGAKVVGLTATPFRVDQGALIGGFFTEVIYDISVRKLIDAGYLCPVISKPSAERIDFGDIARSGYDYNQDQMQSKMDPLTGAHSLEIAATTSDRKHILVFASGVRHAQHLSAALNSLGIKSDFVTGDMMPMERDCKVANFKNGETRALVNCEILTTGFNLPALDCIALVRATKSTSLYVQIVGRGMRTAPNKHDCLILDFGSNIERHGPVDCIEVGRKAKNGKQQIGVAPVKYCACGVVVAIRTVVCLACGYEFPVETMTEAVAAELPVLVEVDESLVESVAYLKHEKEGKPPSMRVIYRLGDVGKANQFLCFEHGGFATTKARQWWVEAFDGEEYALENPSATELPMPKTTDEALELTRYLKRPIKVRGLKKKFYEILNVEFGKKEDMFF